MFASENKTKKKKKKIEPYKSIIFVDKINRLLRNLTGRQLSQLKRRGDWKKSSITNKKFFSRGKLIQCGHYSYWYSLEYLCLSFYFQEIHLLKVHRRLYTPKYKLCLTLLSHPAVFFFCIWQRVLTFSYLFSNGGVQQCNYRGFVSQRVF